MTSFGLHYITYPDFHYSLGPDHGIRREDWRSTYYHRADSVGRGFNRSSTGSNTTGQYFSPLREILDNIHTCTEKYLFWFHDVGWNDTPRSKSTLWQELCLNYFSGTHQVDTMLFPWNTLRDPIDPEIFQHIKGKVKKTKVDAHIWRNTCLQYFQQ